MTGTVLGGSVAVNDVSFLAFWDHTLLMTSLPPYLPVLTFCHFLYLYCKIYEVYNYYNHRIIIHSCHFLYLYCKIYEDRNVYNYN